MRIEEIYQIFLQQGKKLSTDSRKIPRGSIFLALKGDNFNGNEFALQALEKGAAYAIIDEAQEIEDDRYILVSDALECLSKLALHHRKASSCEVLAIAGSNGKTTTKELINAVLQTKYKTIATEGNLNNHIGVPLSLLKIEEDTEIAIIEMGANHPGEVEELCQIAEPNLGLVTSIGKEHLEGFGSMDAIIETELALYRYLKTSSGQCFLYTDDSFLQRSSDEFPNAMLYGSTIGDCLGRLESSTTTMSFKWDSSKQALADAPIVETNMWGDFNYGNALGAACVGRYFSVPYHQINKAISSYSPSNKRSQILFHEGKQLIIDCYNANPSSMELALKSLSSMAGCQKRIAILGDMLEMGKHSLNEHQNIIDQSTFLNIDQFFLIGKEFSEVNIPNEKYSLFQDADDFLNAHELSDFENCCILLKASRGIRLEKLLENIEGHQS